MATARSKRGKAAEAPPEPPSPLAGRKASVILEMGGLCVRIDDVEAGDAFTVGAAMLDGWRALRAHYEELVPVLPDVTGGQAVLVVDDDGDAYDGLRLAPDKRRVGFH